MQKLKLPRNGFLKPKYTWCWHKSPRNSWSWCLKRRRYRGGSASRQRCGLGCLNRRCNRRLCSCQSRRWHRRLNGCLDRCLHRQCERCRRSLWSNSRRLHSCLRGCCDGSGSRRLWVGLSRCQGRHHSRRSSARCAGSSCLLRSSSRCLNSWCLNRRLGRRSHRCYDRHCSCCRGLRRRLSWRTHRDLSRRCRRWCAGGCWLRCRLNRRWGECLYRHGSWRLHHCRCRCLGRRGGLSRCRRLFWRLHRRRWPGCLSRRLTCRRWHRCTGLTCSRADWSGLMLILYQSCCEINLIGTCHHTAGDGAPRSAPSEVSIGTAVAPEGGGLRVKAPVVPAGEGLGDSPGKAAGVFRSESG